MIINHNNYLNYELPSDWCYEEDGDNLLLYDPNGEGAITVSFYSVIDFHKSIDEQLVIMAKQFIERNNLKLIGHISLHISKDLKKILSGEAMMADGWFVKIWIVSNSHKIVFATYQSEKKTSEVNKCDGIINSIQFCFDN